MQDYGTVNLTESDTRANIIDPAIHQRGWTEELIKREETADGIEIVDDRPRRRARGRVDYVLRVKPTRDTQVAQVRDAFNYLLCPAMAERGALRLIGTHPGAPGEVAVFESSAGETFTITRQTIIPSRGGVSRWTRPASPLIQTEPACHVVESNATLATRHGPQLAVQPAA